ncbi:MAG TPA: hypothetical protein DCQ51_19405 [Planktothrix sp. UBA8407]|jgi:hypothetical protein|nr:hypothetical protein [Planktothrix sp. UBA8407]HBK22140.1 hypothetical protein [Planktothrix sp. UBA10369]
MEIFVQSRGISTDYGYNWVKENQVIVEKPNIANNFIDLLQESSSLLIARENQNLLLVVTGIPSARRDYQNRIIFISVAWIVEDNPVKEAKIRNLASKILLSKIFLPDTGEIELNQSIEGCVKAGGENGFTVDFESLGCLLTDQKTSSTSKLLDEKEVLDEKSDKTIDKLAKDLKEQSLPTGDRPLVVVTGIQRHADFKNAKVWRGLAKFVDKPVSPSSDTGDRFQEDSAKKDTRRNGNDIRSNQKFNTDTSELVSSNRSTEKLTVYILALLLIISFVSNTWLYIQYNETKELRQNQENINKSKQEFDKLTADIKSLENEKISLNNDIKLTQNNLISLENQISKKTAIIKSVDQLFDQLKQIFEKAQQIIHRIQEALKQ